MEKFKQTAFYFNNNFPPFPLKRGKTSKESNGNGSFYTSILRYAVFVGACQENQENPACFKGISVRDPHQNIS
jgi:hypothetical protein